METDLAKPRPWLEPGYRFFTPEMSAWMGGYVPEMAQVQKPKAGCQINTAAAIGELKRRRGRPKVEKAAPDWMKDSK